jgi:hypothetical protein
VKAWKSSCVGATSTTIREDELFVLCRSADRREKEKAMHERFVARMEKRIGKSSSKLREMQMQKRSH